jgi:hypothetical protein
MANQHAPEIEVRRQSFTAVELLELLENLHVREQLRKYQAQYNYVFVGLSGQIAGVMRAKRHLTPQECRDAIEVFPHTAYFIAKPGTFDSPAAIERRLRACAEALQTPSAGPANGGAYIKVDGEWVRSVTAVALNKKHN